LSAPSVIAQLKQTAQKKDGMKESDELALKAEIDEISKKIDAIVQTIDRMDPDKPDAEKGQDLPA
jgi:hypothetical protein